LAGYGTGAVIAVPCGDERDYALLISSQSGMQEIKNIFLMLTFLKSYGSKDNVIIAIQISWTALTYKKAQRRLKNWKN
jgi:leucyl-tRNA synthetase